MKNLKLSKTALRELTRLYRCVLIGMCFTFMLTAVSVKAEDGDLTIATGGTVSGDNTGEDITVNLNDLQAVANAVNDEDNGLASKTTLSAVVEDASNTSDDHLGNVIKNTKVDKATSSDSAKSVTSDAVDGTTVVLQENKISVGTIASAKVSDFDDQVETDISASISTTGKALNTALSGKQDTLSGTNKLNLDYVNLNDNQKNALNSGITDELVEKITANESAISTLNGEETVNGSVRKIAKGYADTAVTTSEAYTDNAIKEAIKNDSTNHKVALKGEGTTAQEVYDTTGTATYVTDNAENGKFTGTQVNGGTSNTTLKEALSATNTQVDTNKTDIATNKAALEKLNADVNTTGSVLNSIRGNAENATYTGAKVNGDTTSETLKTALNQTVTTLNNVLTTNGTEIDSQKVDVQWNGTDSTLSATLGTGKYTSENNITKGDSVTTALSQLDKNVGSLSTLTNNVFGGNTTNLTTATNALATNMASAIGGTFASNGKWSDTVDNSATASNGYSYTASTNVMNAVDQVAKNVGTAAQLGAGLNQISSTKTVNQNIAALDTAIGDRTNIDSANEVINTSAATSVADGFYAVGNAIGNQQYTHSHYVTRGADLTSAISALDHGLTNLEDKVDKYHKETKAGFASVAALSALVPNARSNSDTQISVGTGYHRGATGFALGAFHYLNDDVLLNLGGAYAGDSSTTVRGGVTFGF